MPFIICKKFRNRFTTHGDISEKRMGRPPHDGEGSPWETFFDRLQPFTDTFISQSEWCESCGHAMPFIISKKFINRFGSDCGVWEKRMGRAPHRMGRPWGGRKSTFAVLLETRQNSNTICGHMPRLSHLSLEGIGPVVIENEQKYAWGGLPIRMGRAPHAFFRYIFFNTLSIALKLSQMIVGICPQVLYHPQCWIKCEIKKLTWSKFFLYE